MLENEIQEMVKKMIGSLEKENKNKPSNIFYINLDNIRKGNKFDLIDLLKNMPETKSNKNNKTNRITTESMEKGLNKVKVVTDNRKALKKGDIVRIVKGEYKGITKECKFLEYCEGMDKVLIQLDELNPLYVNPEDIELVRKAKEEYKATTFNEIENKYENIIVEIENDMLTVILQDGTKSEKRIKGESRVKIMKITYYDAKIKQYLKATQKLNDIK
ncbi:hypothetical protein CF086_17430 [Clostridium botulinum]|uniref:hypothetical protein n=1 Tax=Clostridium botulinum TaxID=1491 RepID=UPI0007732948|nr:hypothetical protein [Clostridium botulinum]MBN3352080.1 hypothetical protein [Clostridium botulinum]